MENSTMPANSIQQLSSGILQKAKISGAGTYWAYSEAIHGPRKQVAPALTTAVGASQIIQVGESPNGFGKGVIWDRSTDALVLSTFLNAADSLGVSISGLQSSDYVTISSATGLASFSKDTGNPLASSIIGIVGAGLDAVLKLSGVGTLVTPLVDDATKFAQDQFKPSGVKTKIRDSFGYDPGSGDLARQEGGFLVSLPGADGPYYSGDGDHQDRWIKKGNDRSDPNRPAQVVHGFFPLKNASRATNSRQAGAAGEVYISPWDWKFEDNAGFYELFVVVSKNQLPG
jgi:hypothetical protein